MKVDYQSINRGLQAASDRTRERFGITGPLSQNAPEVRQLVRVLESWPNEADARFLALFVELWAVARIARLANNEPMLTDEEIRTFLDQSKTFFNSFLHK